MRRQWRSIEVSSSELLLTCALNCSISSSNLFVSAACAMLICAATQCSAMRRLPHSRSRSEAPEQRTMAAEGKISGQRLDSTRPQHCTSPSGCLGNPPSGKAISARTCWTRQPPHMKWLWALQATPRRFCTDSKQIRQCSKPRLLTWLSNIQVFACARALCIKICGCWSCARSSSEEAASSIASQSMEATATSIARKAFTAVQAVSNWTEERWPSAST
mmetsp:Transcript_41704/g.134853  ORF Transcript_41704/g.134853 Transcript_41704/m.134853 type:complete len:218 (-) Transcript_41704:851-1504(-)